MPIRDVSTIFCFLSFETILTSMSCYGKMQRVIGKQFKMELCEILQFTMYCHVREDKTGAKFLPVFHKSNVMGICECGKRKMDYFSAGVFSLFGYDVNEISSIRD